MLSVSVATAGSVARRAKESEGLQESSFQQDVRAAGERGAGFLGRIRSVEVPYYRGHPLHELTALALLAWDQPVDQGRLSWCLGRIKELPWDHTYNAALRACVDTWLLERNPEDMESFVRLAMAAKFLVETQVPSGMWGYGMAYLPGGKGYLQGSSSARLVAEQVASATGQISAFGRKAGATVRKAREGSSRLKNGENPLSMLAVEGTIRGRLQEGDFSNSQIAALGLAAAAKGRYRVAPDVYLVLSIPGPVLESAIRSWVESQNADGGWGYNRERSASYLSMTAGGLFSLCTLQEIVRRQSSGAAAGAVPRSTMEAARRAEAAVEKAKGWLERHFTVESNAGVQDAWPQDDASLFSFYALFSIERAATAAGIEKLGDRDWYLEGARRLLRTQSQDGGWPEETVTRSEGQDFPEALRGRRDIATCFALLFLKRATARLVPRGTPTLPTER
jgi:hypothetical protein